MVIGNFEWMACFTLILLALVFAPFYFRSGRAHAAGVPGAALLPDARTFLADHRPSSAHC